MKFLQTLDINTNNKEIFNNSIYKENVANTMTSLIDRKNELLGHTFYLLESTVEDYNKFSSAFSNIESNTFDYSNLKKVKYFKFNTDLIKLDSPEYDLNAEIEITTSYLLKEGDVLGHDHYDGRKIYFKITSLKRFTNYFTYTMSPVTILERVNESND